MTEEDEFIKQNPKAAKLYKMTEEIENDLESKAIWGRKLDLKCHPNQFDDLCPKIESSDNTTCAKSKE